MLAISEDIGIHNSEFKSHCAVSEISRKKIVSFVFKDSINNFSVIQTFLLTNRKDWTQIIASKWLSLLPGYLVSTMDS